MKIEILNPIYSQTDTPKLLKECLSFPKTIYRKTQYKKIAKEIKISKIDKTGIFFTGLIPRIQKYCKQNNIDITISKSPEYVELIESISISKTRKLQGIELREDQNRLVESALKYKRGIISAIMGTGKTAIAIDIINKLNCNTLFLVPRLDLLKQTVGELKKFGINSIAALGEGNKTFTNEKVVVSTIQTFVKLDIDQYMDYFGLVILDECHIAVRNLSTIEQILTRIIAPYRIALTATPPDTLEQEIILHGLFGPVLDEVSMEEATELGILAPVKLRLIPVPRCKDIINLTKYSDIYETGIVNYNLRNKIICNEAVNLVEEEKTLIIFINHIQHGENIYKLLSNTDCSVYFVKGDVSGDERERIKKKIQNKEIDICIASSVWTEGVNIPSLGGIIIAGSGKSAIRLVQSIGRGMRAHVGKDECILIDLIDKGKYISEHFCERLTIFYEKGFV